MRGEVMRWTAVLINKAAAMRGEGMTMSRIAEVMSGQTGKDITKEMVRLALRRARRKPKDEFSGDEAGEGPSGGQGPPAAVLEPPRHGEFTLMDLGWRMCRFPMRQVKGEMLSFRFCGADTAGDGLVWCPEHAVRVFNNR
jgi:hypothetical protein